MLNEIDRYKSMAANHLLIALLRFQSSCLVQVNIQQTYTFFTLSSTVNLKQQLMYVLDHAFL